MPDAFWRRAAAATHRVRERSVWSEGAEAPWAGLKTAAVHMQVNEPDKLELRSRVRRASLLEQGAPRRLWERP